jgi:Ca2+-binding EF-hand superfamily protein
MTKMKLAIVIAGCLISGVAAAAPKADVNGDGAVSQQERLAHRQEMKQKRAAMKQKMLATYDTNRDSKLDKAERKVMGEALASEAFKRLDSDGNGVLTLAEFKQGKRFFKHHPRAARAMGRGKRTR